MKQAISDATKSSAAMNRQILPGLPRTGLSPEQQLEALNRVQNQAEQRVRLGLQLFKAAEAHTTSQRQMLDELTEDREKFRDELTADVTRSMHSFDQWIGQMDDTFTQALLSLEGRIETLESKMDDSRQKLEAMLQQSEKWLQQAMLLLEGEGSPLALAKADDASARKTQPATDQPVVETAEVTNQSILSADISLGSTPPTEPTMRGVSYADILDQLSKKQ